MTRRDEPQSGREQAIVAPGMPTGATSSSAMRGPKASGATNDTGERNRSGRPRVAPHPSGPQGQPHNGHALTELPETYGVDEIEILCKDPWWYFAYWEVTDAGLQSARDQLGAAGEEARLVLRIFTTGTSGGPAREIRDVVVQAQHGRRYLESPRSNALLRAAIGLLSPEGYFASIAHSSLVRVPPQQPSPETAVEWLHVLPARSDGAAHDRIVKGSPPKVHEERALPWRSASAGGTSAGVSTSLLEIPGPGQAGGSSELSRPSSEKARDGSKGEP